MYELAVEIDVDKELNKLIKRNPKRVEIIDKKVRQIQEDPHAPYKYLHAPLQGFCSAHVDTPFVIIFRINHTTQKVELHHYAHHDFVYKWRPKEKERIKFV